MLVQLDWAAASCSRSTLSAAAMAAVTEGRPPAVLPAAWEAAGDPEGTFTPAALAGPGEGTACGGLDIKSATKFSLPGT